MKPAFRNGRSVNHNESGVALLIALLFIVLLTVLIVEFVYETQVEATHASGNQRSGEAMLAARSAIATGMSNLVADLQQGNLQVPQQSQQRMDAGQALGFVDSLDEFWAQGVAFQEINNAVMQCTITDEFGKLNLNALLSPVDGQPQPVLVEALRILFETRGMEADPTDAVLDWIDLDESPRPNGVESEYYQTLEVPYASKNGPMDAVEELLLIPGITPDVYFGDPLAEQVPLSELLTVHGDRLGKINLNTAHWELLDALGLAIGQSGLADLVISEREGTGPFLSEDDYINRGVLPRDPPEMQSETTGEDGQPIIPVLRTIPATVASQSFRLRGHGISGSIKVRIEAFVWRDTEGLDGLIRVTNWRVMQ